MSMTRKIVLCLLTLVLLSLIIFVMGVDSLRRANKTINQVARVSAPKVVECGAIEALMRSAELGQRNILLVEKPDERRAVAAESGKIKASMNEHLVKLEQLLPGDPAAAAISKAWQELSQVTDEIISKALLNTNNQAKDLSLNQSAATFTRCVSILDEVGEMLSKSTAFAARPTLERVNRARTMLYQLRNYEKDGILQKDTARIREYVAKGVQLMNELALEVNFIAEGRRLPSAIRSRCVAFGDAYKAVVDVSGQVIAMAERNEDQNAFILAETVGMDKRIQANRLLEQITNSAVTDFEAQTKESEEVFRSSLIRQILITVLGFVVALGIAGYVLRSVTANLKNVIGDLSNSADQVHYAANNIATASDGLAQGARLQADQIQSTSSTLGDMAEMARRNVDNVRTSDATTAATVKLVSDGAVAVRNMSLAMQDINSQSEKIRDIIKTIEEIAFQTNLLALNASVEAARAGEAGKGFAVVADEVRNLATRSAAAAHDTSELIQATVEKVGNGSEIAEELASSFRQIEEGSAKLQSIVSEITTASTEQSHGVEQVNANMAQLDRSTHENSSHAEESTRVAQELTNQAGGLLHIVDRLNTLVGGEKRARVAAAAHMKSTGATKAPGATYSRPKKSLSPPGEAEPVAQATVSPSDLIPLDDDF